MAPQAPKFISSAGTPVSYLPVEYQNVLEPLETLICLAGNTEQISLRTCQIDMLFHNPVVLAMRFATFDILSRGRAIAGLGIGWSKDEYQASGVSFKYKGEMANEFLQSLKRIWTDDVVEFKGRFYSIPASKIGPKPVQKPHSPILFGGTSSKTFLRIVNYVDGWIPIAGFGPLEHHEQAINGLREGARKANKDPSKIRVFALAYPNVLDSSSPSPSTSSSESIDSLAKSSLSNLLCHNIH
jgi:alkanesulfonate monooxygenase SsuD/methylene tetrahydromethanopterin reductase-like flavin-dependent oxidoreductase (luciferase family)